MNLVDAHAHLTDAKYGGNAEEIVKNFSAFGGQIVISSGFDVASSLGSASLAEKFDCVYFSAGVHPDEANGFDESAEAALRELAKCDKCVAIGEIGYDFYHNDADEETQTRVFERQVELADEANKPIVVHSREAHKKTVDFLKDRKSLLRNGFLMHCFAGSAESVKELVDLGGYFSFGGVVTFKNAKKDEVVRAVPADRLLTETDCPYLSPEPLRGSVNYPSNIRFILEKIASIRREDVEFTSRYILNNAKTLFKI